jgi:hypothetical protein
VAGYREEGQSRKIDGGQKFSHNPEPCCLVIWLPGLRTAIAMLAYRVHICPMGTALGMVMRVSRKSA